MSQTCCKNINNHFIFALTFRDYFRSIQCCDSSVQVGQITWNGNWITFIDNMLQLKILEEDTRLLYVPVGIDRLFIDPKKHMQLVKSFQEEEPELPVYLYKTAGIVRLPFAFPNECFGFKVIYPLDVAVLILEVSKRAL